ncbi:butyrophilin subfamily 1 member A1-like isoform X3 [Grus americana]|uniref:butyrophilin subfamily 1 member A1-like isoform X3 n=1 Tax=Grus americana TaxID=9117 RepID=UPI0024083946|nr:butyrophilin subfamily 1 member A1-like isoform X3 [Grus americana]
MAQQHNEALSFAPSLPTNRLLLPVLLGSSFDVYFLTDDLGTDAELQLMLCRVEPEVAPQPGILQLKLRSLVPPVTHDHLLQTQMWLPASPGGLLSYLVTLHVLRLGSADFRVVGPGRPLQVTVGQDVVLPCHLSPSVEARSLDIRWIRHSFSEMVHHYRNGEDLYGEQMEEYVGRTELVRDGLSSGHLDLRISALRPSDDGQYVCTVTDGASYGEATVDLEVSATGSIPQLSLEAYEDGGIRVVCRSAGWYPLPEVLWKDPGGQHLPSVSQRHSSDERGLFDVKDVIVVTNGNRDGKWSCVVRSIRLNQEQETSLHISGATMAARPCGAGSRAGVCCVALSSFDLGFAVQGVGCGGTGGVCTFTALGRLSFCSSAAQTRDCKTIPFPADGFVSQLPFSTMPVPGWLVWGCSSCFQLCSLASVLICGEGKCCSPESWVSPCGPFPQQNLLAKEPPWEGRGFGWLLKLRLNSRVPGWADGGIGWQGAISPDLGRFRTPQREGVGVQPELCLALWEQPWDETLSPLITYCFWFCFAEKRDAALGEQAALLEKRVAALKAWRKFLLPHNPDVVTLDPNSAHPELVLSADGRSVRRGTARQDLPDTPERFTYWCCVLGQEEFREGRHCWGVEVKGEVGGDSWWGVGVARDSVHRNWYLDLSPAGGIWGVRHMSGQFVSLTSPRTSLSPIPIPRRLWVCLDCTQGLVTFIDADSGVEIFTFPPASFNGEIIRPWFWVGTWNTELCLRDSTS